MLTQQSIEMALNKDIEKTIEEEEKEIAIRKKCWNKSTKKVRQR